MKVYNNLLNFLLADDAAPTTHSAEDFQRFMIHYTEVYHDSAVTISVKKPHVMAQDTTLYHTYQSRKQLQHLQTLTPAYYNYNYNNNFRSHCGRKEQLMYEAALRTL